MKRVLSCLATILLTPACAAPGSQHTIPSGGEGAVPYCQTLPTNAPTIAFVDDYYLTTWGSAYREGGVAGLREGLAEGGAVGAVVLGQLQAPSKYKGQDVFDIDHSPDPFCMVFASSYSTVNSATSRAFQELQNRGFVVRSNAGEISSYETGFRERAHTSARWIERFVAAVEPLPDGRSLVVLSRGIYIARDESGFYQGQSVGQNEAAILTRIRDLVSDK